jgi:hypothetical protein
VFSFVLEFTFTLVSFAVIRLISIITVTIAIAIAVAVIPITVAAELLVGGGVFLYP